MADESSLSPTTSTVTIVGAGPVGLYTALYLAKAGIETTVFERESEPLKAPRAMAYFPVVLEDFAKMGILDDILQAGFINTNGVAWRRPGGEVLASIEGHPDHPTVQIGQDEVATVILDNLKQYPHITVRFNCCLRSSTQDGETVKSVFDVGPDSKVLEHTSQYLVGADGGKSTIRRILGISLEGFTWDDFQTVAANVEYDFGGELGWHPANFVVDPTYWAVIARVGRGNVWRVASGDQVEDEWDTEAGIQRLRERVARMIGRPFDDVKVLSIAPYRSHQRCASKFVEGRVVLAGDAAHLTNPTGGLGLTTGWLDAALLGRNLVKIIKDGQPATLLEEYGAVRRRVFMDHTNRIATQNRKRLVSTGPKDIQERKEFFARLNSSDTSFLAQLAHEESCISSTRGLP